MKKLYSTAWALTAVMLFAGLCPQDIAAQDNAAAQITKAETAAAQNAGKQAYTQGIDLQPFSQTNESEYTLHADTTSLEQRLQLLEAKLNRLEKKEKSWDKILTYVSPSGFMQTSYTYNDAGTSSFAVKRASFILRGNLYNGNAGKVDYFFQADFAGGAKILDMYVRYMPVDEAGIKMGEFKSPLTIENSEYSPTKLEFINYSLAVERFARMSDRDLSGYSAAGRDIGIEFLGSALKRDGFSILNYELAIFNGHKLNAVDNNKSKDIVARLMVNPSRNLTIAGYGQWGEGNFPVFDEAALTYTAQADHFYQKMHRYGSGIAYKSEDCFARAEVVSGKTAGMKSLGGYAAAGSKVAKDLTAVARFDYFDEDTHTKSIFEMNYTAGLIYSPLKNLDLKLNYTFRQLQKHKNQNCICLMLTFKY